VVIFVLRLIGSPTRKKGSGVIGFELDRLVQILNRVGVIALFVISRAA
jgi:hypothetical protein